MPLRGKDEAIKVMRSFVNNTIPNKVKATAQQIATFGLEKALQLSPYVSGRFMSSWRVSVGEVSREYEFDKQASEESAAANARSQSAAAISQISMGVTFYISNASPHAEYVEYGSPTTVPRYITRRVAQAIGGKYGRIKT